MKINFLLIASFLSLLFDQFFTQTSVPTKTYKEIELEDYVSFIIKF